MISCSDLTFKYTSKSENVFSNLHFNIEKGSAVLLTGPSGCGKSTLAYCISGLYPEYAGELSGMVTIKSNENDVQAMNPNQRAKFISILFQNPDDQFCMDTPESEIMFAFENINYSGDMDKKCTSLLEFVGMKEYRRSRIHTLSGGMKQKVALASALATEPDVLILDEPFANIDPDSINEILPRIKNLNQEHDMTLIIIDHKTEHWEGIADRLILMNNKGEIKADTNLKSVPSQSEIFKKYGIKDKFEHVNYLPNIQASNLNPTGSAMAIKAENFSVSYKEKNVIVNMDIEIPKSQITMITGRNGSGKSTLMWALTGLMKYEGKLDVNGDAGIVFQNPNYQFLTHKVIDEISLSKPDSDCMELLAEFGLDHKFDQSPYMISQGQQRRLAVLAMLACEKDILLLDEPTYGQDHESTKFIMELINRKVRQGLTAIISTHDMDLVNEYGQKIINLSNNREDDTECIL